MMERFLDAWADPQMRHAMVVHFPIVLSLVGIPFAVLAALWQATQRGRVFQWVTLATYLALTASLYVARESGHDAEDLAGPMSESGEQELEEHEHHGHDLWQWSAVICAVAGLGFVRHRVVHIGSAWLVVVGAGLTAERIAHTADHGGRLVYEHGAAAGRDLAALIAVSTSGDTEIDPRLAHFREQVMPILVEHCLRCHNPTRKKRAGGLDQSTMAGLLAGGYSGPAIVPGRPDESLLMTAVRWADPDLQMPLNKDKLSDETIAALDTWITDGAVWEPFSYTPPAKSAR